MKRDEFLGWYGTAAILIAYALINFNIISLEGYLYQLLNTTGALGIAYISFKKRAYQPGVLNVIWAAIALIAIMSLLTK